MAMDIVDLMIADHVIGVSDLHNLPVVVQKDADALIEFRQGLT